MNLCLIDFGGSFENVKFWGLKWKWWNVEMWFWDLALFEDLWTLDHAQNTIQNVFARLFGENGSVHSKSQVGVCEAYVKVWISCELRNDFEIWCLSTVNDGSKSF